MTWLQITFKTDSNQVEVLSEALTEAGSLAITLKDAADHPIYEPPLDSTPVWPQVLVIGLFDDASPLASILEKITSRFPGAHYCIEQLAEKDWQNVWMVDFKPLSFGKRLQIIPSHYESQVTIEPTSVLLDPGLAFGTGTHPTTALCLEWLDQEIKGGEQVIDYGCGSGILGIAALKLGASHVYAIDHDPQALIATQENAARNKMTQDQLTTLFPEQLPKKIQADILIANILAQPLAELANTFTDLIKPQGKIVLSGILKNQVAHLESIYKKWFNLKVSFKDEWACLDGVKKSPL